MDTAYLFLSAVWLNLAYIMMGVIFGLYRLVLQMRRHRKPRSTYSPNSVGPRRHGGLQKLIVWVIAPLIVSNVGMNCYFYFQEVRPQLGFEQIIGIEPPASVSGVTIAYSGNNVDPIFWLHFKIAPADVHEVLTAGGHLQEGVESEANIRRAILAPPPAWWRPGKVPGSWTCFNAADPDDNNVYVSHDNRDVYVMWPTSVFD
jgi:hypothetical protein